MLVFDASTLIVLSKAKLLGLVLDAYDGEVATTETAAREATGADTEDAAFIRTALAEGRLPARRAPGDVDRLMEEFRIQRGEAEAIAIAAGATTARAGGAAGGEAGAGVVVATDDARAMRACRAKSLPFAPAVSFVVRAWEKDLIPEGEAHAKLEELARRHGYDRAIIEDAHHRVTGGSVS